MDKGEFMKERIQDMIDTIKSGRYDQEETHSAYDALLEDFIKNYDATLSTMMFELIDLEKDFWYA